MYTCKSEQTDDVLNEAIPQKGRFHWVEHLYSLVNAPALL